MSQAMSIATIASASSGVGGRNGMAADHPDTIDRRNHGGLSTGSFDDLRLSVTERILRTMTILLTGATGTVGAALTSELAGRPGVRALVRSTAAAEDLAPKG